MNQAVWMVHGRQLISRFRFWLSMSGYDPKDHSFGHKLYLLYALVFWSLWLFAVLAFFAGMVARGIVMLQAEGLPLNQVDILTGLAAGMVLVQIYRGARTAPLVFTEDDANLICATPVPREAVAQAWFLGEVPVNGLPFWAGAVILAFSLIEARLGGVVTWADAPMYVSAGFRALIVAIPLFAGLLALAWAASLARNRGWIRGGALRGLVIGAAVLGAAGQLSGFGLVNQLVLLPIRTAAQASLTGSGMWIGLAVGVVLLAVGIPLLRHSARGISLSQVAQETMSSAARQDALMTLNPALTSELDLLSRLGTGQKPFPHFTGTGWRALLWKRLVQAWRSRRFGLVWDWGSLALFTGGVLAAPNTPARLLSAVLWALTVCQRCSSGMEKDMQRWNPLRSLPVTGGQMVLAAGLLPGTAALGITLLVCLVIAAAGSPLAAGSLALLAPGLCACLSFASVADLLRRADTRELVAEISPTMELTGLGLGLLSTAIPVGLAWWLYSQGIPPALSLAAAGAGLIIGASLLWRYAAGEWHRLLAPGAA